MAKMLGPKIVEAGPMLDGGEAPEPLAEVGDLGLGTGTMPPAPPPPVELAQVPARRPDPVPVAAPARPAIPIPPLIWRDENWADIPPTPSPLPPPSVIPEALELPAAPTVEPTILVPFNPGPDVLQFLPTAARPEIEAPAVEPGTSAMTGRHLPFPVPQLDSPATESPGPGTGTLASLAALRRPTAVATPEPIPDRRAPAPAAVKPPSQLWSSPVFKAAVIVILLLIAWRAAT